MIHFHKWEFKGVKGVENKNDYSRAVWYTTRFLYMCSVCKRPRVVEKDGNWTEVL